MSDDSSRPRLDKQLIVEGLDLRDGILPAIDGQIESPFGLQVQPFDHGLVRWNSPGIDAAYLRDGGQGCDQSHHQRYNRTVPHGGHSAKNGNGQEGSERTTVSLPARGAKYEHRNRAE